MTRGDNGKTDIGMSRIPKTDILMELIWSLDNLSVTLGSDYPNIQYDIYKINSWLHLVPMMDKKNKIVLELDIESLDDTIKYLENKHKLKNFILPEYICEHRSRIACRLAEIYFLKVFHYDQNSPEISNKVILESPNNLNISENTNIHEISGEFEILINPKSYYKKIIGDIVNDDDFIEDVKNIREYLNRLSKYMFWQSLEKQNVIYAMNKDGCCFIRDKNKDRFIKLFILIFVLLFIFAIIWQIFILVK